MRAEAASGESFGAESDSDLWLDPSARSRGAQEDGKEAPFFYDIKWFSLVGYSGNGDAHDERKRIDCGGNVFGGNSRNSPSRGVWYRTDVRTGTAPGDGARISDGNSCGCRR